MQGSQHHSGAAVHGRRPGARGGRWYSVSKSPVWFWSRFVFHKPLSLGTMKYQTDSKVRWQGVSYEWLKTHPWLASFYPGEVGLWAGLFPRTSWTGHDQSEGTGFHHQVLNTNTLVFLFPPPRALPHVIWTPKIVSKLQNLLLRKQGNMFLWVS